MKKRHLFSIILVAILIVSSCKKADNMGETPVPTPPTIPTVSEPGYVVSTVPQLLAALNSAVAGDVITLNDGTYTITTPLEFKNSGTLNKPITIKAKNKRMAVIDGNLTVPANYQSTGFRNREGGLIKISRKSWLIIDGLKLINSLRNGVNIMASDNITVKNCHTYNTYASGIIANYIGPDNNVAARETSANITVINNEVERACYDPTDTFVDECITMRGVKTYEVAYNIVHDRIFTGTEPNQGGEGIDSKRECTNGKVHHNLVYDLMDLGLYVDAFGDVLSNVEVYSNTVYNCSMGIVIANEESTGKATNIKVYNNLVRNIGGVGIRLAGYQLNGPIENIYVYNNTVVRCGQVSTNAVDKRGIWVQANNVANANFVISNNIVAYNTEQVNVINATTQPYVVINNNLLWGNTGTAGTNRIDADPKLVDPTGNALADYRLQSSSPAIDKALSGNGIVIPNQDIRDFFRPLIGLGNGATALADLGAFEFDPTKP